LVKRAGQGQRGIGTKLRFKAVVEPIRQVAADSRRKVGFRHRLGGGQPFFLTGLEYRRQLALTPATGHGQCRQQAATIRQLAGAARFQAAATAQHGEHRFGDKRAVGMTKLAMLAKIARHDGIGRVVKAQQLAEDGFGVGKQGKGEAGFH
jgi:hypothetical protein